MQINFDAFTEESQAVAQQVVLIASRNQQSHLDLEHIMLALLEIPGSELEQVFDLVGIDKEELLRRLSFIVSKMPRRIESAVKTRQFTVDQRMKTVIEQAQHEAIRLWNKEIKPVHLFLAAVQLCLGDEKKTACGRLIAETGITSDTIRRILAFNA